MCSLKRHWKKPVLPLFKYTKIALYYPTAERETVWERVQQQYVSYLSDWRTDLGGKKNFHNSTGDTYDCIALMSYYTVCKAVTKLILHWSFAAKEYINETFTF